MKPVYLQPVFVLHCRAYRETSFLAELFTPEYGRLTVVAKGVCKSLLGSHLLHGRQLFTKRGKSNE